MGLAAGLLHAAGETARLRQSMEHLAGASTAATKAAARLVPPIFRRDSEAEIAALAHEQFSTGITLRLLSAGAEQFTRFQAAAAQIPRAVPGPALPQGTVTTAPDVQFAILRATPVQLSMAHMPIFQAEDALRLARVLQGIANTRR